MVETKDTGRTFPLKTLIRVTGTVTASGKRIVVHDAVMKLYDRDKDPARNRVKGEL